MNTSEVSQFKYDTLEAYLVFSVKEQFFGMPHRNIIAVVDKPEYTAIPGMAEKMRGVMDFMGEAVPIVDFRKMVGVPTICQEIAEFADTLQKRKQDHLNWIEKLKNAVTSGSEITVEMNPHKCAFGKWYDAYETEKLSIARYMRKFDSPHKLIHSIAGQAREFIKNGDREGALELIRRTEMNELAQLVKLFDEAKSVLEVALAEYCILVHDGSERKMGIAVDEPKYFGLLDEITYPFPEMFDGKKEGMVDAYGILKSDERQSEILIVGIEKIFSELGESP